MEYTSLELSKKLWDNGCRLKSKQYYVAYLLNPSKDGKSFCSDAMKDLDTKYYADYKTSTSSFPPQGIDIEAFPSYYRYDVIYDICVKYATEFFGEKFDYFDKYDEKQVLHGELLKEYHPKIILNLIQQNKQQKAEDYIWEHCLFNPKNNKVSYRT